MTGYKMLKRAEAQLKKELDKQIDIIYPACALVWWDDYGWRGTRIKRRYDKAMEIWNECADYGVEKSMLQMLEEETGIDLQLQGCPDWHEKQYLNYAAWDGKGVTLPQAVYMRQQQIRWVAPLLMACICLTLHWVEHWGPDRIAVFVGKVDALRAQIGEKPDEFRAMLESKTDLTIADTRYAKGAKR